MFNLQVDDKNNGIKIVFWSLFSYFSAADSEIKTEWERFWLLFLFPGASVTADFQLPACRIPALRLSARRTRINETGLRGALIHLHGS